MPRSSLSARRSSARHLLVAQGLRSSYTRVRESSAEFTSK